MRIITIVLLFLIATGCKKAIKNESQENEIAENINFGTPDITKNLLVVTKADLLGYWVGEFNSDLSETEMDVIREQDKTQSYNFRKKITFSIDKIKGDIVEGHSVVGGNIAAFKGELEDLHESFRLIVTEINNERTDGKFILKIAIGNKTMTGKWNANNKLAVPIYSRKLILEKKFFVYNPENNLEDQFIDYENSKSEEVEYESESEDSLGNPIMEKGVFDEYYTTTSAVDSLNPSKQLFKKELVENLSKADIYILRNLIFARHGFTFRDRKLREYFDNHSWYMPIYSDVKNELTPVEKKNIDLLLRYEQNAKEYYDTFGR
jgi:hypothetical protein